MQYQIGSADVPDEGSKPLVQANENHRNPLIKHPEFTFDVLVAVREEAVLRLSFHLMHESL